MPKRPWAEIVGPCFTADAIARELGWTATQVTRAAASLNLLELETSDGVLLYPAFQLWEGGVVAGLTPVLQALSTGTASRWTWAQWLNTPVDDESGDAAASAVEQLRAGQLHDVLRDARHVAWAWSQ